MATKSDLEAQNIELITRVEKLEEELARGGVKKLEENNVRFSKGDDVYSVKINQNGQLTIQALDGFIHTSPISSNVIVLFQTAKPMF
ncbi:MAG: hypothetical protein U9P72_02205 [Campylobacterota bacterium]|nr:hypothetical protein [Campylobacterota bacterium]